MVWHRAEIEIDDGASIEANPVGLPDKKMRTNKVSDIIVIEVLQGVKREEDQGIC